LTPDTTNFRAFLFFRRVVSFALALTSKMTSVPAMRSAIVLLLAAAAKKPRKQNKESPRFLSTVVPIPIGFPSTLRGVRGAAQSNVYPLHHHHHYHHHLLLLLPKSTTYHGTFWITRNGGLHTTGNH